MNPLNLNKLLPLLLLLLSCCWSAFTAAQNYSQEQYLAMIARYVERTINIYDGTWAYSYTTADHIDGDTLARRINPALPFMQSEVILAENGMPPSPERLERHERRMQRRLERQQDRDRSMVEEEKAREGSEKERFLDLLIPDSLKLVSRNGALHTLEFRGLEEERKKIYEHLTGRLVLDTRREFIRELQVRVSEPFSPYFFMRINSGYFSLRFDLHDGVPVQTDATWQLDGHILYVKSLDRDQEVRWFDIDKIVAEEND